MEHLTKEQLTELKQKLEESTIQLRSEIREELVRADEERYADLAGQVHDDGDDSVADLLVDTNIARVNQLVAELREAESALERIKMGSYGVCEDSGEEIPFERLRAYPSARRTVEQQAQYERTFAGSRSPTM